MEVPVAVSLLSFLADSATLLGVRPTPSGDDGRKRVLLVRPDAIGDFVLWLDAARGIRELYPADRYRLTLLGNRIWTELADRLPIFDEVVPLDRSRFLRHLTYRARLLRGIRRSGYDVAIHPVFSREFLLGDSIVWASGAKVRIGSEGDGSNQVPLLKRTSDRWYTHLVPAAKGSLMELERNAEFLRALGLTDFRCDVPVLSGFPAPSRPPRSPDYFVLFPGAGDPLKRWPTNCFAELGRRISQATGWNGIVCGGPGEEALGEAVAGRVAGRMENRAGRTSLPELVSLISGARLLVGNDTSAIHIAAAVSTPSVCILGGGHYGRFLPYRTEKQTDRPLPAPVVHRMDCFDCNWRCVHRLLPGEPAPCITGISVGAAWEAVRTMLAASLPPAAVLPLPEPACGGRRVRGERRENRPAQPLISIVTVVRNGAAHIERAIRSVLKQTYPNVEYIVVDGASTDGTLDILRKYDDRIDYWVSEPDDGIYHAMNKGISLATGELVGILNSDDEYLPGALEEVASAYLPHRGRDVVLTGRWNVLFQGRDLGITLSPTEKFHFPRICHQATFVPKGTYAGYGAYDTRYSLSADLEMAVRLHAAGVRFLLLPATLVRYTAFGASGREYRRTSKEQSAILRKYLPLHRFVLFQLFRARSEVLTGSYPVVRRILGERLTDLLTKRYFSWKVRSSSRERQP